MEQPLFVLLQIFNLLLIAIWLFLTIGTIVALQRRTLSANQYLLWAIFIICVPFLGAAAFWYLQPNQS
jgi:hypothetical protein